ncbi:MAG: winged helix-turn-helix domain-containing protein [Myxococcales bacterium]|nr:winged helix-turn-helix domain-containing protein [Myxococcales bacterium]
MSSAAHIADILVVSGDSPPPSELIAELWGSGYRVEVRPSLPDDTGPWDLTIDARGELPSDVLTEAHARFPPLPELRLSDVTADLAKGSATRPDGVVHLTRMEVRLLRFLAAHPHRPISQQELLLKVWGYREGTRSRTVATTMHRLRKKVEVHPSAPIHLRSVYGVGFSFVPSEEPVRHVASAPPPPLPDEGRVPAPRDRLVGREELLADVRQRWADTRLVTLWGPPGSGKTRLAYEIAHETPLPGGSALVDLSNASTRLHVVQAAARAIGASSPSDMSQTLRSRGGMLLVLDNCETVLESLAEPVSDWLDNAPELRVLATSRHPVRLRGEHLVTVPPLALPSGPTPSEVRASSAAQLFSIRARATGTELAPTPATAAEICRIVTLLDGLPLALELAAGRCHTLTLETLRQRLEHHLDALVSTERDRDPRHRALHAALDCSWSLLEPGQRRALGRLSTFAGGAHERAAVAVVADGEEQQARAWLDALARHGLLRRDEDPLLGEMRLSLLHVVRTYAAAKLDTPGAFPGSGPEGTEEARRAHQASVLADIGRWRSGGPDKALHLREMALETDNLSVALRRASARGDLDAAVTLLERLYEVALHVGPRGMEIELGEQLLPLTTHSPTHRLVVTSMLGSGYLELDQYEAAETHLRAALNDADHLGNTDRQMLMAERLSNLMLRQRRIAEAVEFYERALKTATPAHTFRLANMRSMLGHGACRAGKLPEGIAQMTEARDALVGHSAVLEHVAIGNLSEAQRVMGRPRAARQGAETLLRFAESIGHRYLQACGFGLLGRVCLDEGDAAAAHTLLEQSAEAHAALTNPYAEAEERGALAEALMRLGRLDDAETQLRKAMPLAAEVGQAGIETALGYKLAKVLATKGELEQSRLLLARPMPDDWLDTRLQALADRAEGLFLCGMDTRAHAVVREAEQAASTLKAPPNSPIHIRLQELRRRQRALPDR